MAQCKLDGQLASERILTPRGFSALLPFGTHAATCCLLWILELVSGKRAALPGYIVRRNVSAGCEPAVSR